MLLRCLGLPRALCERGYRPSGRGHRRQRPAHHPGDIAAAGPLLDRGWGKAKEMHEHSGSDSKPLEKIVREIVYMPPPGEIESIEDMDQPLEITFVRSNGNGSGRP